MEILHLLSSTSSRSTQPTQPAFLLRNQIGTTATFYPIRQTRYEGWFIPYQESFYKILERIELVDETGTPRSVEGIVSTLQTAFWEYADGTRLGWRLVPNQIGLTLSANQTVHFRLSLDCRPQYSQPQWQRDYKVINEESGYLIEYTDAEHGEKVFIHIRTTIRLEEGAGWENQAYPRDESRHSSPTSLYSYTLGTITTDHLSLGFGWNAEEARSASVAASEHLISLPENGPKYSHDTLLNNTNTAKATVRQGLRWLETQKGLYAGLPWFHQVWSRDELIAALGLNAAEQHEIIERYLGLPLENGELPTYQGSGTTCADGIGWLCLLIREYDELSLQPDLQQRIISRLTEAYTQLKVHHQAGHGLIHSSHNATWMDTIGRSGYRLEIQCMYALLLDILHSLTEDEVYEKERLRMLGVIRQHFWQHGYLTDGLNDTSIRPNIFLAYLLQPDLLQKDEWTSCFTTALQALQLPWGGLSSLDQQHPQFQPMSTGEDNLSYHNGDSWFFINNLAGVALHRLNSHHFAKQIVAILQSSTEEILWHNMLGMPGEISSASELDSFGCGLQAFSGGTYLALLKQLEESYSFGHEGAASNDFFWESNTSRT